MDSPNKQLEKLLLLTGVLLVLTIIVIQFSRNHPQRLIPKLSEDAAAEHLKSSLLTGSVTASSRAEMPHYYILDIREANEGQFHQFVKTLEYAKLPYTIIGERELASLKPSPYHTLITATEKLSVSQLTHIASFVKNGGNLYVGKRFNENQFNTLAGIKSNEGFSQSSVHGIDITKPWNTIYEKLPPVEAIVNNSMKVTIADESVLYMESEGTPLFWTSSYGDGRVGYFNGTWLSSKSSRGLFLQTLELVPKRFVAALTGVEVVYIDDFPAPFPEKWGADQTAYQEYYAMSPQAFLQNVWWADMKDTASESDLLYTTVMIGTYEDKINASGKELVEKNRKELSYYARDAYHHGHEVGLHGYNHQPLLLGSEAIDGTLGYTPWGSKETMAEGINYMQHLLKEYYPTSSFKTYVPPSNILDETGIAILESELPDLRTISAVYDGQVAGSYIQEIGTDNKHPQFFNLPRFSSGFHVDESNRLGAVDALGHLGMVSHFVHPDDLISSRSNGFMWEQLKVEFTSFLSELKTAYPILSPYTASQATAYLERFLDGTVSIQQTEDSISIGATDMPTPIRLLIRLNDGEHLEHTQSSDVTVYPIGDDGSTYQLELRKVPVVLPISKGVDAK